MEFTKKHFDPLRRGGEPVDDDVVAFAAGEAPEDVYLYPRRTVLAVNVALATRRPLLISGEPGSGKSTMARNAAAVLGWSYYKQTITSRTQAADLLYTFDTLRRLNDASTPGVPLQPNQHYVEPGTLWWAFDPVTASQRGKAELPAAFRAKDPRLAEGTHDKAVVLLDEIDKADPDVPNDLLEPFDLKAFRVKETGDDITPTREVLLILTTNGERELPPAFLRRCVTLALDPPTEDWFVGIAVRRYGATNSQLYRDIAKEVMRLRGKAVEKALRPAGTGEYLDALAACRDLDVRTDYDAWLDVARSVLWKHERTPVPAASKPAPVAAANA